MSQVILISRKTVGPFDIKERKPKPLGVTKYTVFKGEEQVKDFGKYSTALRWCKQQVPREVPHVVIVEGDTSNRQSRSQLAVAKTHVRYTYIQGPYRITADAIVDPEQFDKLTNPQ